MRVLVVTNMWPSPERPALGGFVRDQVDALREIDGLELELYAFQGGGPSEYVRAAREVRRRYANERFDVVHAHYGLTAWCSLGVRGAPHVVTFHGTDLAHRAVGPMSRAVARLVDAPAPVSASLARTRLPGAGRARRVPVLPCGVNLERFSPRDRREARSALGLDADARYLLFPADPRRPEKRHDRARTLAERAGAELLSYDNTHPDQVPLMVSSADAVLITSEREGFGLASLEALAANVPVLATDVGIAPLALRGVEGTHCAPFDVESWLAALRPHLESPDPRVEGRERAATFDRNRMAQRVFEAYRDLADERLGRASRGNASL